MIRATIGILASQGGVKLLLDTYSGAAAAYSLRLLSSTYTGDAIRVRRASDNTEQDIGFVNNELDTSTLTTFCSGTNGFVKTWYDQSGNGYDAEQTTVANQPQIVSSGSVILENGKPSIDFNGTSYQMQSNFGLTLSQPNNFYTVSKNDSSNDIFILIDGYTTGLRNTIFKTNALTPTNKYALDAGNYPNGESSFVDDNNQKLIYSLFDGASSSIGLNNGTAETVNSGTQSIDGITIGARFNINDHWWSGTIQEIVLYNSDQSSNRTGIETNINDFYSIY